MPTCYAPLLIGKITGLSIPSEEQRSLFMKKNRSNELRRKTSANQFLVGKQPAQGLTTFLVLQHGPL